MTKETVEAVILVQSFFKDYEKTALWLSTQNLNIGGTTPIQMRGWVSENQIQALQNILRGVQENDELQGEGPVY